MDLFYLLINTRVFNMNYENLLNKLLIFLVVVYIIWTNHQLTIELAVK